MPLTGEAKMKRQRERRAEQRAAREEAQRIKIPERIYDREVSTDAEKLVELDKAIQESIDEGTSEWMIQTLRDYRDKIQEKVGPPDSDIGLVVQKWAYDTLKVPTGPLRGQPFHIADWQASFLTDAFSDGVRESGLSVARKNGKSGLIAALLLAYLAGPLNRPDWRSVVVSLTGALASELRNAIEATANASGLGDKIKVRRSPPPGTITGADDSLITILASDRATGHAIGTDLAIVDEAGLLPETRRVLWDAVYSSMSGRDGRLMAISIQGDGPMFKEMQDRKGQPGLIWHEYSVPEETKLDDEQAWHMANPGLKDGIKSITYMRDASARALAIPSNAPTFRAYDLNQPQAPSREVLCGVDEWIDCEVEEWALPDRDGICVVGFDLGGSSSMTTLVALWPNTGRMECYGAFPGEPDLIIRGRADGVAGLYEQMQANGELQVYPGRVTPVGAFLHDCADRLSGEKIIYAGSDRYRKAEAEQAMAEAGVKWDMMFRGQGASQSADGSHDVRAMQRLIYKRGIQIKRSLMMRSAIAESSIRRDGSGNPALDKSRDKGRIDALSAAVIAAGLMEIYLAKPKKPARYLGLVQD